jgi:propionyl-CoA carboxylase beta chain
MKELILKVVDEGDFFEIQPGYAGNIVIGFRPHGRAHRRHRRQPADGAGRLPRHRFRRARRRASCASATAFSIPIVTFVDVPGFLPGTAQEYGGIIKHGAKLLFAYAEATVPKVTVITRKAYGGAYDVMASKHLRGDMNYAWPTAEIAVMGAEGARSKSSSAGCRRRGKDRGADRGITRNSRPSSPADRGFIDDVIMPHSTRRRLPRAAHAARQGSRKPWKKHDNIPL